jgi:antitoxin ParD1/3/4
MSQQSLREGVAAAFAELRRSSRSVRSQTQINLRLETIRMRAQRRVQHVAPGAREYTAAVSLPNFAKLPRLASVSTMNISLPEELKDFVDEQVRRGYGTSSEYVRELIRKDQDRLRLRELLLAGAASPPAASAGASYFKKLRRRLRAGQATGHRR